MASKAILVGVDASATSQFAVAWATREAARRGIGVHIVHAADERAYGLWLAPESVRDGLRDLARPTLVRAQANAQAVDPTVPVTGSVIIGPAADVMARRAGRFELVVVGRHGAGPVAAHLPGGVPRRLIGEAKSPTVVVGPWPHDNQAAIGRVVVAIGAPDEPEEPIQFAFDQARELGVPLLAVHAWQVTAMAPLGMSLSQAHPATLSAHAFDEVKGVIDPWRERYPDVTVSVRSSEGTTAHVLPTVCRPDDLLVIGHARPAHRHLHHVGAIAASALREAPCAVAVIPTGPKLRTPKKPTKRAARKAAVELQVL